MILTLIAEATECDFKKALERDKPISWLKSVSAFANGAGGTLFFDANDDGSVEGLADAQSDAEFISRRIKDRITPLPDFILKPEFRSTISSFTVKLKNVNYDSAQVSAQVTAQVSDQDSDQDISSKILEFCRVARSKKEICEYMGYGNLSYFTRKFLAPLIASDKLRLTVPDKPNSKKQKYYTIGSTV
jgi:predicted HTH transcriptional regulator